MCKEIESTIGAIAQGLYDPSMKAKADTLEAEKAALEAKLRHIPEPQPVAIHPGLFDFYAGKIARLALNDVVSRPEATDLLSGLIGKIVLRPYPDAANGHVIELFGEVGAIFWLCSNGWAQMQKPAVELWALSK